MVDVEFIDPDEIILRRIPPNPEGVQPKLEGGSRAASFVLKRRRGELGPSFGRLSKISPRELLQLLWKDGISPEGWRVAVLKVSHVRSLGWDVIDVPQKGFPGHCEIRATDQQSFRDSLWSRLAKKTRVLTEEETNNLQAGTSRLF